MNHIKLVGQFHDNSIHVFHQLVQFLSHSRKPGTAETSEMFTPNLLPSALVLTPATGGSQLSFTHADSIVKPDLELLCNKLKMEPQFAFRVARPFVGAALAHRR